MKTTFSISVTDFKTEESENAVGQITIGDFTEEFIISLKFASIDDYTKQWHKALTEILKEKTAVVLMQCLVPKGIDSFRRAWILYREEKNIYVQENLFPADLHNIKYDEKGVPINIPIREIISEDGDQISEWEMSTKDVYYFLEDINAI